MPGSFSLVIALIKAVFTCACVNETLLKSLWSLERTSLRLLKRYHPVVENNCSNCSTNDGPKGDDNGDDDDHGDDRNL